MKETRYQLGIDAYQRRIDEIDERLPGANDWDKLNLTEEREEKQLKIKHNQRRQRIIFEGGDINEQST